MSAQQARGLYKRFYRLAGLLLSVSKPAGVELRKHIRTHFRSRGRAAAVSYKDERELLERAERTLHVLYLGWRGHGPYRAVVRNVAAASFQCRLRKRTKQPFKLPELLGDSNAQRYRGALVLMDRLRALDDAFGTCFAMVVPRGYAGKAPKEPAAASAAVEDDEEDEETVAPGSVDEDETSISDDAVGSVDIQGRATTVSGQEWMNDEFDEEEIRYPQGGGGGGGGGAAGGGGGG